MWLGCPTGMPSPETPTRRHVDHERQDELLDDFRDGRGSVPGIHLPDEFGPRLEGIVVVSEDGADHFANRQEGPGSPD